MKIVPSILTDDPEDLKLKIHQVESFSEIAQIDIMDGEFVPSKSITAENLSNIDTKLFLEIHLMVNYPVKEILSFKKARAKRIIFHFESKDDPESTIKEIRGQNMEVGLAINPETKIDKVERFLDKIDILLIMGVNPGFYGSRFIPEVLDKCRSLQFRKRKFLLGLDGGVKLNNIKEIKDSGIEIVYVGSGIFAIGEPKKNFFLLLEKIKDI